MRAIELPVATNIASHTCSILCPTYSHTDDVCRHHSLSTCNTAHCSTQAQPSLHTHTQYLAWSDILHSPQGTRGTICLWSNTQLDSQELINYGGTQSQGTLGMSKKEDTSTYLIARVLSLTDSARNIMLHELSRSSVHRSICRVPCHTFLARTPLVVDTRALKLLYL